MDTPHLDTVSLAGLVAIRQGTPEVGQAEIWSITGHKGSLAQPEARSRRATGHLSAFAGMTPEDQAQHLMSDHHIPASLVKAYRRQERGRTEVVGEYSRLHNGLHSGGGKLSIPRRLGLTGGPMTGTPHLDKLVALVSQESIDEVGRISRAYPDGVHTREELASANLAVAKNLAVYHGPARHLQRALRAAMVHQDFRHDYLRRHP